MARDRRTAGSQARLGGRPRWLLSTGLAAAATALVCWPAWPGYMSFDSLLAYEQGLHGVYTMLWPPLHAYLFALSQAAGAQAWGLFLVQTFAIFFGANLSINLFARDARWAAALCLAFMASFVYVPGQMGVLFAHWRDVTTASFALLGLAAWLVAAHYRQLPLLLPAAAAFGAAVALRYNALPLVAFLLASMIWRPLLQPRPSGAARAAAAAAVVLSLGLAWASTHWRAPDLLRMPATENLAITQAFDLIGISACADRDLLPPSLNGQAPMSGMQIRQNYDPRHLNLSLAAKPGVRPFGRGKPDEIAQAWPSAVAREPGCYLAHRAAVFVEQMGLGRGEVFYPTHGGIDANPYGLALAHPKAAAWVNAYVARNAPEPWRRPILLYGAALAIGLAAAWRRRDLAGLFLAILAGAFAYVAALFVAAPAADARYIFPSNTLCALLIVLGVGVLAGEPRPPRR